jgi:hypothetical protein
MTAPEHSTMDVTDESGSANGAGMAAVLGAGIGAFAVGLVVILNEAGVFAVPALYGPAGGVSGRTSLAALIWVIGWAVLHARWKHCQIDSRGVRVLALILTGLGILLTLPPVWQLV